MTTDRAATRASPRRRLALGALLVVVVTVAIAMFFWGGIFRFEPEAGETFWHLFHQKGHWYLELVISGIETLVFDLLIGVLGWRFLLKPYIAERQARLIAADHALHGIAEHGPAGRSPTGGAAR